VFSATFNSFYWLSEEKNTIDCMQITDKPYRASLHITAMVQQNDKNFKIVRFLKKYC